ncbi:hypothetical protein L596_019329 [Steinernema carpocapsae]|uniref:mRNA-decapping enzyme C-terminal domain-containing protein n=2 Tax=Steinernema carpocapsae TaxID=34508 RepID=A0A4U5MQD8_STECR|nr:hypothetical protein L596_019329 [Steinernema carpocapsae]
MNLSVQLFQQHFALPRMLKMPQIRDYNLQSPQLSLHPSALSHFDKKNHLKQNQFKPCHLKKRSAVPANLPHPLSNLHPVPPRPHCISPPAYRTSAAANALRSFPPPADDRFSSSSRRRPNAAVRRRSRFAPFSSFFPCRNYDPNALSARFRVPKNAFKSDASLPIDHKMDQGKPVPITQEDAKRNFASIKRIDPCAASIIDNSTHVALYRFNSTTKQWERTDIDGPLFVYKRVDRPFHSLMIANRHSREDYIEPVTSRVQVEQRCPYVFFCRPDNVINGLWFYKEADCKRIYETLSKLIKMSSAGPSPSLPMEAPKTVVVNSVKVEVVAPKPPVEGNDALTDLFNRMKFIAPTPPNPPSVAAAESSTVGTPAPPVLKLLRENKSVNSLANLSTASVFGSESEPRLDDPSEGGKSLASNAAAASAMLSKEQLYQAMQYLLETDDDFLQRLHQAYADSINRRLLGRGIDTPEE